MNDRIKEIRKDNNLTLEKFGEKIGLKRSALSHIENGTNNVTERVIQSVCKEFNVNEDWLRYGKGDKYIETSNYQRIMHLTHDLLYEEPDSFRNRFVSMLDELDITEWKMLEKMCISIVAKKKED